MSLKSIPAWIWQSLPIDVHERPAVCDSLVHIVCDCSEDISLCGLKFGPDVPKLQWREYDNDCVVCLELFTLTCPRCHREQGCGA